MNKKPYRINGEDVVVKAENALYTNTDMPNVADAKGALDNLNGRVEELEENGGGGGGEITVDAIMDDMSANAVQNKVIKQYVDEKLTEVTVSSIPAGSVVVADNLTTDSSTSVLSAKQGKKLDGAKQARMELFVAASDAPDWQKAGADYLCDGVNDEVQIQAAINALGDYGGRIRLSAGTFIVDALPTVRNHYLSNGEQGNYKIAIALPTGKGAEYIIEGDTMRLRVDGSSNGNAGTIIKMSDTLYNSLNDPSDDSLPNEQYALLAPKNVNGYYVSLQMRNLAFFLPWNGKRIICIDTQYVSRVTIDHIFCYAYRKGFDPNHDHSSIPVPMPTQYCIGVRSVNGGNWGTCLDFRNTLVQGFYEGYQLGGEHLVGVNMAAIGNYYGYTFGNYIYTDISCHTMTLINCSDEQAACGPKFVKCNQYQDVHIIGWNEERYAPNTPGQQRVQNATCDPQSTDAQKFRGYITYAIMDDTWISKVSLPFWETGHGANFVTRNSTHKNYASWYEISSYKGDLGEIIYDTTNNRLVVCTAVSASGTTWRAIATTSV